MTLILRRSRPLSLLPSDQLEDVARRSDVVQPRAVLKDGATIRMPRTGNEDAYEITRKRPICDRKLLLYLATVDGRDAGVKTTKKSWLEFQTSALWREYERLKGLKHPSTSRHLVSSMQTDIHL